MIAGAIAALYPNLWLYDGLLMPEALAGVLVALAAVELPAPTQQAHAERRVARRCGRVGGPDPAYLFSSSRCSCCRCASPPVRRSGRAPAHGRGRDPHGSRW